MKKSLSLHLSLIPIITIIVFGLLSVIKWKAGMNIPIISGIVAAAIIGKYQGNTWKELQNSLVQGVSRALPALFIMIVIGAIMGSWIQGGIIPALIYYSMKIISPSIFLPAACLITAIVAVATGTSFTSIATVGLALMATGLGMGFPASILAGAIISGAYFGDSMSPLSDTTNLASAVTESDLYELIAHLMKLGLPALVISTVLYYILGIQHATGGAMDLTIIEGILTGVKESFNINPLLLLIPALTILFSIIKIPALPSLLLVAVLGGLSALIIQGNELGSVIRVMTSGYVSQTGNQMIDSLLSRGGINSMGSTVILLTLATAFGGILEEIGALNSLLDVIMAKVNSNGRLVLFTAISSLVVAFSTGAQLLAIVIPGRMFGDAFKERNLQAKNLGRIAQSIGCVCINLVPWSVPALFAQNVLGVSAVEFIPYLFFAHFIILVNLIYGYTGWTMDSINKTESKKIYKNEINGGN